MDSFKDIPLDKIALLHISDATNDFQRNKYKDRNRVMPGDGIIDLKKFCNIAKEKNFQGDISLGVYNYNNWDKDPFLLAKNGYDKLKRTVES
jgi:2-keto-myo-inositol isomerase